MYRRGDMIGIPYAITVDDTTLEKGTVTLRDRDSMRQIEINTEELVEYITKLLTADCHEPKPLSVKRLVIMS